MDLLSGFEITLEAKEEEIRGLRQQQKYIEQDLDNVQEKLMIALAQSAKYLNPTSYPQTAMPSYAVNLDRKLDFVTQILSKQHS